MKIERHETGPRMSKAVIHGETVYLAGIVADGPKGKSVAEQTRSILAQIDGFLAMAGTDKTKQSVSALVPRITARSYRGNYEVNLRRATPAQLASAPARAIIIATRFRLDRLWLAMLNVLQRVRLRQGPASRPILSHRSLSRS